MPLSTSGPDPNPFPLRDISGVVITHGLPSHLRYGAAYIFYTAFKRKLIPLLGAGESAIESIAQDLDEERSILAIADEQVIGLAGLSYSGRRFAKFGRQAFTSRFGLIGGFFRYAAYASFNLPDLPGEILVDGLAVDEWWRGRGIGTMLLEAVFELAERSGIHSVKLTVVDTNPDARRLYERLGFVAGRTRTYPEFMVRTAGFRQEITMVKKVRIGDAP